MNTDSVAPPITHSSPLTTPASARSSDSTAIRDTSRSKCPLGDAVAPKLRNIAEFIGAQERQR